MRIVKIAPLNNGAHQNQTGSFSTIPEGWAVIPDDMVTENFPFGELVAEDVEGVMTVTSWTPTEMPETPVRSKKTLTQLDAIEAQVTYTAMMTDTLLEV